MTISSLISGITALWNLGIRYIAIDRSFPHHLNSFDNVPINYLSGALVNITISSPTLKFYYNTINYTTQATAVGSTYTTFSSPLTNNKILLFMTSLYILGLNDNTGTANPVTVIIVPTVMSTDTYKLNVTYGVKGNITKLHYSMIMFDSVDV